METSNQVNRIDKHYFKVTRSGDMMMASPSADDELRYVAEELLRNGQLNSLEAEQLLDIVDRLLPVSNEVSEDEKTIAQALGGIKLRNGKLIKPGFEIVKREIKKLGFYTGEGRLETIMSNLDQSVDNLIARR